jgi:hypothetical protein
MRCALLIGAFHASDTELCDMSLGSLLTPAIVAYLECAEVQSIHHDQFTNARKGRELFQQGGCKSYSDRAEFISVT